MQFDGDVAHDAITHHETGSVYETVAGLEVALDEEALEAGDLRCAEVLVESGRGPRGVCVRLTAEPDVLEAVGEAFEGQTAHGALRAESGCIAEDLGGDLLEAFVADLGRLLARAATL